MTAHTETAPPRDGSYRAYTLPWPPSVNRLWRNNGRDVVYKSDEAKAYGWQVVAALSEQDGRCLTGDVALSVTLYRPRKSGDTDNYLKVMIDCLQGRLFEDDKQIVELHAYRKDDKTNPRVEVELWSL